MRWKYSVWKNGDIRIIRKFALLPIFIKGEVRWLEWVSIKQMAGRGHTLYEWINLEFIDNYDKAIVRAAKENLDKEMEYEFKEGVYKDINKVQPIQNRSEFNLRTNIQKQA